MVDFKIVINAVGSHGQDCEKKNGDTVDFGTGTPESIASEFVQKLKDSGVQVENAYVEHWPLENYGGQIKNGRTSQIVDDLISGKRIGSF